jgi:3-dehydroquinate dehydratase-1
MKRPSICAVITEADIRSVKDIEAQVDLFEVRIDLIGDAWPSVAGELKKPWIACNRMTEEGGQWRDSEARRIEKLLQAIDVGASIIDVELKTKNLENVIATIKKRAGCLVSSHNLVKTPSLEELKMVVKRQMDAGADICKVVTTATTNNDNWTIMRLLSEVHDIPCIAFAMGPLGALSRVLSPVAGGYFTYASIKAGKESAPGQITVQDLISLYEMMGMT